MLCYSYQHMCTHVYKCLAAHNTIIHSEQEEWEMNAPLGHMLESIDLAKESNRTTAHRLEVEDVHIDMAEAAECSTKGGTCPRAGTRHIKGTRTYPKFDPTWKELDLEPQ